MTIDTLRGIFSRKDNINRNIQPAAIQETGNTSFKSTQPIAENPDAERAARNKLAEYANREV